MIVMLMDLSFINMNLDSPNPILVFVHQYINQSTLRQFIVLYNLP